jgi:peroxisomal 2,4-dienoyl-CoA reductase
MQHDFRNKTVLVVGGGSGIGEGIAGAFAEAGAHVFISGRSEARLVAACARIGAKCPAGTPKPVGLAGDARLKESVLAVVDALPRVLDVLVYAAAGNFLAAAADLTSNGFRTVLEIDTLGAFNYARACLPLLRAAPGGGVILAISATLQLTQTPYLSHASAAKAALDSLISSWAVEWGSEGGTRVVGIAPGPIEGTEGMSRLSSPSADEAGTYLESIPLSRLGTKKDCADAALFLADNAVASYITGVVLPVDGGSRLYRPPTVSPAVYRDLIRAGKKRARL